MAPDLFWQIVILMVFGAGILNLLIAAWRR
jgi:hypothetical protein